MGVFLTILKIIGIVLLSIIGFILFLLLLLLICPIRYKAEVKAHGDIEVHAKVKYLFILSVPVNFVENKLDYAVKVIGITVFPRKKKEKKKKDKQAEEVLTGQATSENVEALIEKAEETKEAKEAEADAKAMEVSKNTSTIVKVPEKPKDEKSEQKAKKKKKKKGDEFALDIEDLEDDDTKEKEKEPKKPFKEKLKDKWEWLKHAIEVLAKGYRDGVQSVQTFFKRKSTKFTIAKVKKTVIKIVLHIRPRKLSGNLEFGFDDPATTGYACAGASLLYGFYCNNFELTPNFTEKKLEGEVKLKGHIVLGYLVIKALGLIIRRKVRQFIKNVKGLVNEETENISKVKEGILDYERD